MWCTDRTDLVRLLLRLTEDPHSPGMARIRQTLKNTPEFADAFSCKADSKMAPKPDERCIPFPANGAGARVSIFKMVAVIMVLVKAFRQF